MKWFSNLKVASKVLLSCLILIIFTVAISVSSLMLLNQAEDSFQSFYADRFVPVRELNRMAKNVLQMRINMMAELVAFQNNDAAEMDRRVKSSADLAEQNAKIWEDYLKTEIVDEEEIIKNRIEDLEKRRTLVRTEFARALHNNDIELAAEKSNEWVKIYQESKTAMDNMMQFQQDYANKLRDDMEAASRFALLFNISMLSVSILFGIIITIVLARAISKPVAKGLKFAQDLANGDFRNRIDLDQNDELGQLGKALNTAADDLENTMTEIIVGVQNLVQAINEISAGNENLSQRTSEQASSLEEIASTIEENTATINKNADNSIEANKLSKNTSVLAEDGGTVMDEALSSINDINESSKKIEEIISVINEIAFQTNLLALNAAVEAARAGEQGRGFAVVAGEVRNLAQRSGNASKEIATLIQETLGRVGKGTELTNKAGESLREIISSINDVSRFISEIAVASEEQKRGTEQINMAVSELDSMTQQNAGLVEETASASEEMSNQAQELLQKVEKFKVRESKTQSAVQNRAIHIKSLEKKPAAYRQESQQKPNQVQRNGNVKKQDDIEKILTNDGFESF
ncbi:MAG: MCP four helix bundle domain-containing protein [Spirochaetes bacterium]|nr:MCP four helix bundle domain-containing protein [Spirochaetota bacterium]